MFHAVVKISERLSEGFKLSDRFGKCPELLQNVTLEDLIFTGINMKFEDSNHSEYISPFLLLYLHREQ